MVAATQENKRRTQEYIRTLSPADGTASFDAILASMRLDDNLEVLFFLSDGEATHGKIVAPKRIVEAVSSENYFRRIAIHTIGFATTPNSDRFLRSLAAQSSGSHRAIGTR